MLRAFHTLCMRLCVLLLRMYPSCTIPSYITLIYAGLKVFTLACSMVHCIVLLEYPDHALQ